MNKFTSLDVINCFPNYSLYERGLNGSELLEFFLISIALVALLLLYYNNIPNSNSDENDIQSEITISSWPKLFIYLVIIISCIILLVEFFNFGNLFTIFDIIILSSLAAIILYFNITPKITKVIKKQNLNNPIYQSKDILLQSNDSGANFILIEKTTSIWAKVLIYILIVYFVFTPIHEFLGLSLL